MYNQWVIQPGGNAKKAINEIVATVKLAKKLGYSRFWESEHHDYALIAGSTHEVLMGETGR